MPKFVKQLEAKNRELTQSNNSLTKEVGLLRVRSGKLASELSNLNSENSQLEQGLSDVIDNVPRFDEYIKLLGFQRVINRRSTEAEMYHFNKAEAQDVFKLGSNVVKSFMKNEEANIPFRNDTTKTAKLLFDKQVSSTGNDYTLRVQVTDRADNSIETDRVNDFINKYEKYITLNKVDQSIDSMKLLEEVVDNKYSIISAKEELDSLEYLKSNVLNGIHESYHDEIRGGFMSYEHISALEKKENAKLDVEIANTEKYLNKFLDKEKELQKYIETNGSNYNDYLKDNRVDEIVDYIDHTGDNFEDAYDNVIEDKQETSQSLSL
ncbi:hypothetical protein HMI01_29600 [Halolactibacillus miurensis]|uniref:Uncharacterized protein n=1 Tax=Halolactibacillus miurensis TaxID=306541 RepID=A0A1I6U4J0_9BACI|nr:hypothetical protein [Halolactibacillus miurensis]GEM05972.1 hypothetical protein HMI01_29600 [Halolactibacillus miurensis]SFS96187.1 hypothetical protein SAMN05421668_12152 [Halolactibacillus miurensis]